MAFGLLLLRLIVGGTIAVHGAQKLWGVLDGPGIDGFSGMTKKLGFTPSRTYAQVAGWAEFGGGVLLILGFLTPFGAAAVAGMMIGAIVTVHRPNGFFNTHGGIEFPLLLGVVALVPAYTGPGRFSLDRVADLRMAGLAWGLVATALAGIGSMIILATRSEEDPAAMEKTESIETPANAI